MNELTLLNIFCFFFLPVLFIFFYYFNYKKLTSFLSDPKKILYLSSFLFLIILSILKYSKFITNNYEYFDFGLIYNEFTSNFNKNFSEIVSYYLNFSHFSPLKIIYFYFYKVTNNFLFLILFQTFFITISGFFLYHFLNLIKLEPKKISIAILIFYFNPITSFFDILGFHIEHLLFPLIILTFYFYEKKNLFVSFLFLLLISFISEVYILTSAFFGLYFIFDKKKLYGISIFTFFLIFFVFIFFFYQPLVGSISSYKYVFADTSAYFDYQKFDLINFFKNIIDIHKLFLLYFLFISFGFFININFKILLICIPSFLKVFLSSELYHYSIDGHYLNDLFIILLIAYSYEIRFIEKKLFIKLKDILSITALSAFLISDSVFPLSVNFFSQTHAATYNYRNYISKFTENDHRAFNYLLSVKDLKIIELTNARYPTFIYKNFTVKFFPSNNLIKSDLIILPKNKDVYFGGSHLSQNSYNRRFIATNKKINKYFRIVKETDNFKFYIRSK